MADAAHRALATGAAAGLLWLLPSGLAALPEAADETRVRVAASERYRAGRIHRFALGGGYRDLWESEVELPLLDLAQVGGGLVPTGRFGGLQTAVLGFRGADGRSYSFRGTDKDPSAVLHPVLRDTLVEAVVQDQMAAQHPGGAPVAGVLSEAAGVLTVRERMVVMPDDPRLGEFRQEFAGMVGSFFEYPQAASGARAGFADAEQIIDHEALYAALERGGEVEVDVRAFLRARLVDILLGDFDRHRKQWRWAKLPDTPHWQPIPEDRDMAFVRYDGFGLRLMKIYIPILQRYDEDYPFIKGLTLHGWEQDRWLLPALSWSEWEPIAADIQARLPDEVIERALAQLPPEYAALDAERLRKDIRGRRDALQRAARSFYEHLAREVDVQTSDASDDVRVEHGEDGGMLVEVRERGADGAAGRVRFRRRFDPGETEEVRLYLRGGDDRVEIEGASCIGLRIVAGPGEKRVDDRHGGAARIYDAEGKVEVLAGSGTRVDRRPYQPPPSDSGFVDVENVPPRDWQSDTIPVLEFGFQPDVGVYLGMSVAHTRYGFRKHPYSSKHSLGLGWAFEARQPRLRYQGLFRAENSKLLAEVDLRYSGIEVLRFYGFGNHTPDRGADRLFRVRSQQYQAAANLVVPLSDDRVRVRVGPYLKFSRTFKGRRLIDVLHPYGNNDFGLAGAEVQLSFDTRRSVRTSLKSLELPFHDNPAAGYPTSGIFVELSGRFNPPIWDVDESYGSIAGSIAGFMSFGEAARATLGLRVGGEETFGDTPYFDLAHIGGGRFFSGNATARGFRSRRFTGDSAVYANADARLFLLRFKLIVPSDFGVHGFFDAGRVFVGGDDSESWHLSGGFGIWLAPLVRTNTVSLSFAYGAEETLAYLRLGFHY